MQLKETFTGAVQEKNNALKENIKLKDLLRSHGISLGSLETSSSAGLGDIDMSNIGSSAGSQAGGYGYTQSFSPPRPPNSSSASPADQAQAQAGSELIGGPQSLYQQQRGGFDHEQAGVDFVLASVPQQGTSNMGHISPPAHPPPPRLS